MGSKNRNFPATILVAAGDKVLADSLRFSLELEGYQVVFCNEHTLLGAIAANKPPALLILDQDVFGRMAALGSDCRFEAFGVPVILLVGHTTGRLLARAEAAGVKRLVEKPLLAGALFDAVRVELGRT